MITATRKIGECCCGCGTIIDKGHNFEIVEGEFFIEGHKANPVKPTQKELEKSATIDNLIAGATPATETENPAPAEKPKRKRTTRKAKAPTKEDHEAAQVADSAGGEDFTRVEPESKPKKKRTRKPKKPATPPPAEQVKPTDPELWNQAVDKAGGTEDMKVTFNPNNAPATPVEPESTPEATKADAGQPKQESPNGITVRMICEQKHTDAEIFDAVLALYPDRNPKQIKADISVNRSELNRGNYKRARAEFKIADGTRLMRFDRDGNGELIPFGTPTVGKVEQPKPKKPGGLKKLAGAVK